MDSPPGSDSPPGTDPVDGVRARLAAEQVSATSGDGLVTVVVTGLGDLVDVRLDGALLTAATPRSLGLSTMEALAAARGAAGELTGYLMAAELR